MRVVVIGAGFHGRGVAYALADAPDVDALIVADRDADSARRVAQKIGAEWRRLEVQDTAALTALLDGATLVFNAIGPYHYRRNALCVVEAALDRRVDYVDMSDDCEVAEALLLDPGWNERAERAGVAVVTGTGIAPGLSGMLAKLGYQELERCDAIDVRFSWNYSLAYPAALHHFFRINSGMAPQYIDGAYVRPGAFAGRERVTFLPPVGEREVYYTGIHDPVSISCSLPGPRRVTARGAYHQPEANALLEAMVRFGFTRYEPVLAGGLAPFELLMEYLGSDAGRAHFDIPPEDAPMAVRVEVSGADARGPRTQLFEAHDASRRGTTSSAARIALMLARGELDFRGVRAPEGCVDPGVLLRGLAGEPDLSFYTWQAGEAPAPLTFG